MTGVVVTMEAWSGPWADDDPDANFKREVALYATADPLATVSSLAEAVGLPVGAIVHYVLARWASEGSAGLLELGPRMVERLWSVCVGADEAASDEARLAAYEQLRQMLSWLRLPLADPPDA